MDISLLQHRPKAIFFDWDATIINPWVRIHKALNMTLQHFNFQELTMQEVVDICVKKNEPYINEHNFPNQSRAINEYYKKISTGIPFAPQALEYAEDVLKMAKKNDLFLAVISNQINEILQKDVDHLNFRQYFDIVLGIETIEDMKPNTKMADIAIRLMEKKLGYSINDRYKDIAFIGDSILDVICAHNIQSTAISFGGYLKDEELAGYRYYKVQNHKDFFNHLDKIL